MREYRTDFIPNDLILLLTIILSFLFLFFKIEKNELDCNFEKIVGSDKKELFYVTDKNTIIEGKFIIGQYVKVCKEK